jgi:D-arabinose 1-dehydrogenase-like Zn-dependent alcohol dehydrogenase
VRAVQLVKFGEPGGALQYTDLPDPKPGPGEVVVKIEAAGVCGRDLVVRKGAFLHVKPPVVPGHEGVGCHIAAVVKSGKSRRCLATRGLGAISRLL